MTDQQLDLDHLAALAAAATPGPWHLTDSSAIVAPRTADTIADVWEPTAASRNGEFIEATREAIPSLVAEVRRLRAELAQARINALTEGAAAIDHLRATMLAPPVADRYATGLSGAAGELRRLAAALAEESHVVADDSDDPEHTDDCPGCATAPAARSAAV